MTEEQKFPNSYKVANQFAEAAKKKNTFLHTIKEWNKDTKAKYYQLKDDYMKKRELHAIDLGLDKVMPEWMWPR